MIVRSKNRLVLGEYKEYCVSSNNIIYGIINSIDDSTNIGEYSTQERAIEVLNEIQSRIVNEKFINIAKHDLNNTSWAYNIGDFVYEMPQE